DPRYRSLDRMLARAYIELAQQNQKAGFFAPRMDLCDDPENTHIANALGLSMPGVKLVSVADFYCIRTKRWQSIFSNKTTMQTTRPSPLSEPNSAAPSDPEASAPPPSLYPVRELKYGKFKREIDLPAGVELGSTTLVEDMVTISWPHDPTS
ncbi:hypothetical protein LXA43DRAFT_841527, partial [Ganoderma leucocontextum]